MQDAHRLLYRLPVANQFFVLRLIEELKLIEIFELLHDIPEDLAFFKGAALRAAIVQLFYGLSNLLLLEVVVARDVDPLFARSLVALHPVPVDFLHAERAVFVVGIVLVAFHAEYVLPVAAVLLGFQFGGAHAAFKTIFTCVFLLYEGLLRYSFQFAANGVIYIFAGDALDGAALHCHLALNARSTFLTVP